MPALLVCLIMQERQVLMNTCSQVRGKMLPIFQRDYNKEKEAGHTQDEILNLPLELSRSNYKSSDASIQPFLFLFHQTGEKYEK